MKIDFSQPIMQINGESLKDNSEGTVRDVTLKDICFAALTKLLKENGDAERITGDQKFKNGMLAEAIYKNKTLDLKAEEIANLKKRIGLLYLPEVVVAAWNLLDPEK